MISSLREGGQKLISFNDFNNARAFDYFWSLTMGVGGGGCGRHLYKVTYVYSELLEHSYTQSRRLSGPGPHVRELAWSFIFKDGQKFFRLRLLKLIRTALKTRPKRTKISYRLQKLSLASQWTPFESVSIICSNRHYFPPIIMRSKP